MCNSCLCCLLSCRKGEFAVFAVADVLDIGLLQEGAQLIVHGAVLDAQLLAFRLKAEVKPSYSI